MFKKIGKTGHIILSSILILIGVLHFTVLKDSFTNIDEELKGFFAGFFLAVGIGNLFRVLFLSKKS